METLVTFVPWFRIADLFKKYDRKKKIFTTRSPLEGGGENQKKEQKSVRIFNKMTSKLMSFPSKKSAKTMKKTKFLAAFLLAIGWNNH